MILGIDTKLTRFGGFFFVCNLYNFIIMDGSNSHSHSKSYYLFNCIYTNYLIS